ncbi:receptor-like protein EIX1 [Bidens hawaiensis]|uniref:receptor-like protein EIX1 n=1 Tax=Bidens hawaiensis TaxID=980011 RepID=UPI0040499D86
MGNKWGLRLHFIFVTIFLVTATNTGLSARNTTVACFEHERLALIKFKQSVTDRNGMLSSWVGNDCCRWKRVMCDGVTGNVDSLHLRGDFSVSFGEYLVSKALGTSLRELKHLKYMDLSGNVFYGSRFPKFIGSLKQLTYLNLSNAGFSGIISHHIGNLSNLKTLDLSSDIYNVHDLIAHDVSSISRLSSLEHLDLSYANLSQTKILDVVLYQTLSLKVLSLSRCGLVIDERDLLRNLSTTLSNIEHLDLSWNYFTSQLPHFFQNMTSLQSLELSFIPLSATSNFVNLLNMIPSSLELHLSYCNNQETHLSHVFHNLTTLSNIQHLDLSSNNLPGSIPLSVRKLKSLQVLDLSSNKLTGHVPTFPQKLTELHLSGNDLNGSIPVSIGQLSKLRSLDVSHNSLEGVVFESHFANLSMLKDLNAAFNNKLIINVSHEWLPPFQLIQIDLTSCQIVNGFPQWLRSQRELHRLILYNTTISGPLPTWLRKMPNIPFLDLSHNNISGPLTNLPSGVTNIDDDWYFFNQRLFLQNNTFYESIPWSLCKRTDLLYLDLSNNKLTGEIPKCFKNLHGLQFLRLNSNELSGILPSFIGNFSMLKLLNLNDNNFSGEPPEDIWRLSWLNVLDLGDNALCGKIPKWIGEKMKGLWVFRLHNNNFTGEIPRSLCTNSELQILDVAHNNLRGAIPHCLGELQGMVNDHYLVDFGEGTEEALTQIVKGIALEYTSNWYYFTNMDLSSNKLSGEIPVQLTALSGLVGLNFSNNHLSGGIPDNIGNMTALISLDFSGNELSGWIPPSIAALTFLSHLNLSNNNLSGRIPTGNQLQTLIDPSIYGGNKYLCGDPLPNNCSNQQDPTAIAKKKYETANEPNMVWFYMDITWGFAIGFWGVIIVLMLKKQWRRKLFVFAEETMDKIHVAVKTRS